MWVDIILRLNGIDGHEWEYCDKRSKSTKLYNELMENITVNKTDRNFKSELWGVRPKYLLAINRGKDSNQRIIGNPYSLKLFLKPGWILFIVFFLVTLSDCFTKDTPPSAER